MEWMAWTLPTALFFAAVGVLLLGMTLLELRRPCVERRGYLPLVTSRGDRIGGDRRAGPGGSGDGDGL